MLNLHQKKSLERNRDQQQLNTSTTSLTSVKFYENEICAQSSQFNLNCAVHRPPPISAASPPPTNMPEKHFVCPNHQWSTIDLIVPKYRHMMR